MIFTPNSSKTSADPLLPVIALFPCFATGIPVDATIIEDAVEMFSHFSPLPPVPHISIAFSLFGIFKEYFRIILAIPAISSAVSPFIVKEVINDPNCEGNILPDIICSIAC